MAFRAKERNFFALITPWNIFVGGASFTGLVSRQLIWKGCTIFCLRSPLKKSLPTLVVIQNPRRRCRGVGGGLKASHVPWCVYTPVWCGYCSHGGVDTFTYTQRRVVDIPKCWWYAVPITTF